MEISEAAKQAAINCVPYEGFNNAYDNSEIRRCELIIQAAIDEALKDAVKGAEALVRASEGRVKARDEEIKRLQDVLKELNSWVENWSPEFTQDDEYPETRAKVLQALAATERESLIINRPIERGDEND
jgi:hypothetical protein